ncbi:MAG: 2-oxoadipate dioxygenase/decarboxylase family protein [Gammaproteobacteria bacterium]
MRRLAAAALRDLFVERATAKFAANVPDFVALQELVKEQGGTFRNDHGAIRTADVALRDLFARAAGVLGLKRELDYEFPAKKLKSFDLQVPGKDAGQFKVFVSQVDLHAFPKDVAALIREDCAEQAAAMDFGPFEHRVGIAERDHGLAERDADAFLDVFVNKLMQRNGPPLKRATLEAVAAVSGEAASALALGPDFNHVTIDVRAAGFSGIEEMASAMRARGFRMLPEIQGKPGTRLRQTATMAATMDTPVREAGGKIGRARTEKQFVEIIERNKVVAHEAIFKNFLAANAEKIFDAASTKVTRG